MHWYIPSKYQLQELFDLLRASNNRVISFFLICAQCVVFIATVTVIALVIARVKYAQQRKELEQMIEMYYQSGLALVRYVMLNRQCSEIVAYQRIKTFVKNHVPFDEQSSIDRMFLYDRQGLLDKAVSTLVLAPDEIDKI
ncbi:MAG TPA: hypothetical protein DHW02_12780 [Ktedonobacter sp.]|nr:hypothetical protein [Ktedonobacter sp.]